MPNAILPKRSEVPPEETWNLASMFPSIDDWNEALRSVESEITKIKVYQGKLGESPQILLNYFKEAESITRLAMKVMVYAALDASTDVSASDAVARAGQGRSLMAKTASARAFSEPELMTIGFEKLRHWIELLPDLEPYRHYIEDLERKSAYVLSSDVEEVLAMASEPMQPATPYTSLVNSELKFKPAISSKGEELDLGQSSISAMLTNPDREIRRTAYENYANGYLEFKNTIAAIQTMAFQRDVFYARARGYESTLAASMFPNNIPTDVFHNLIRVFKENLPIWHKYWRIRKAALGVEELNAYDIKAPLTKETYPVPYPQAVDWIYGGMSPLGDEYASILRDGCTINRWVDRAQNQGKRQGAFSWGCYDSQPYIMMSYSEDVFSMSTLAHELGHSMHSYYSRRTQPFINSHYTLFAAEVASNFNQAMVRDYLFKTINDPEFQMALIEEAMSNYHRYFFIMPLLAQWELEMHQRVEQGKPVNADIYTQRCAELFSEGYGNEVKHEKQQSGITWAQFQHMYMNYYVYAYATGISGAHALASRVINHEEGAVSDYLGFLSAGGSMYPLDALKRAGVDLRDPEPVEKAFAVLGDIVDRLETLIEC